MINNLFTFLSIGICILITVCPIRAQQNTSSAFTIARIKYGGGGDWYGNKTALYNLLNYLKKETNIDVANEPINVEIMAEELFSYPFAYIAGHGNIRLTEAEVYRFRNYLSHGGFLFADDDYGMDKFFRREMKRVFPDKDFVELPFSHNIYHIYYQFPKGLPKVHEHDGGPPRGYGLFHEGRLVVFYTTNTDISDGLEDTGIHNDPEPIRKEAMKMATNIVIYALTH